MNLLQMLLCNYLLYCSVFLLAVLQLFADNMDINICWKKNVYLPSRFIVIIHLNVPIQNILSLWKQVLCSASRVIVFQRKTELEKCILPTLTNLLKLLLLFYRHSIYALLRLIASCECVRINVCSLFVFHCC